MHCLIVNDIVLIDGKGVLHPDLQEFYNAYRASRGADAAPPREWLALARGAARAWLDLRLGPAVRALTGATAPVLVHIAHWPIPQRFLDGSGALNQRFRDLAAYLNRSDITRKLWDRLGAFDDLTTEAAQLLRTTAEVSQGYLNILKGNIAEVFSIPQQLVTLARIREVYPDAVLITGIRVRTPGSAARRLYSDNVIGSFTAAGNLVIHHVFEIKAGYNGGVEGSSQIVRWHERFEEGVELLVPADADIFSIPRSGDTTGILRRTAHEHVEFLEVGSATRAGTDFVFGHNIADAGSRAIALRGASRDVITALGESAITPQGISAIGLDQVIQAGVDVERIPLGISHEEIDYLVSYLLRNR